jgi:hypothetical protein
MAEGIHIFSNGFEFRCWEERNCARCVKGSGPDQLPTCDLLAALFTDGLLDGLYQGQVLPETADRLGYTDEYLGVLGWPCKEREPGAPGQTPEPAPAQREMVKAGAAQLPGFEARQPGSTGGDGGAGDGGAS